MAQLAGWQAYDVAEYGIAQRYFALALDLARAGLKSTRAVRYVRDLQHLLSPHRSRPAVRRLTAQADSLLGRRR